MIKRIKPEQLIEVISGLTLFFAHIGIILPIPRIIGTNQLHQFRQLLLPIFAQLNKARQRLKPIPYQAGRAGTDFASAGLTVLAANFCRNAASVSWWSKPANDWQTAD